jgi:KDO2-lipid IV(A) lauroyltransferase
MLNALGSLLYVLNLKHRRIIVKNLEFAMGDQLTPEARENIAKQCYQRFLNYTANFIRISNDDESYLRSIVTFENEHFLTDALARNEKIILVSAHYGHWELILQAVGAFYAPISTIGERLMNSARLNDTLVTYRQKNNVEMFQKEGALIGLVKAMKKGRILAYLVDQNYKKGVEVSFFEKSVMHIQSASQLSRKFDALILPVFCTTDDFETYTIRFQEPYKCIKTADEKMDIVTCTQKQADIIQKAIEKRPYDYFWFHKKFKGKYPKIYKEL